jgi:hypothetical protein
MWGAGAGVAAPLAEERGEGGLKVKRDLVEQEGCVPGVWNEDPHHQYTFAVHSEKEKDLRINQCKQPLAK